MCTYKEKLSPYVQFKRIQEVDEEVTKFRMVIGYKFTKSDNRILDYIKAYSVRYTGVFYQKIETIANNLELSLATVKRALAKFVLFGLIKRIPKIREKQGGKGASIYQFQFFKSQNEPSKMSHCDEKKSSSKPCESKSEENSVENKPFNSSKKDLKDIKTYQQAEESPNEEDNDSFVPKKLTNYQKMKMLISNLFHSKDITYRLYGVWRIQTSKMINKPPFDLAMESLNILILEIKRRVASNRPPLSNPVGYFSGILENLINDYVEEQALVAYDQLVELQKGPEWLHW